MKRFALALVALLLSGGAIAACPAYSGYIAHGQAKQPKALKAICGPSYAKFIRGLGNDGVIKWGELYNIDAALYTSSLGNQIASGITKAGYTMADRKSSDDGSTGEFDYINLSNKRIIVMQFHLVNDLVFMTLVGN